MIRNALTSSDEVEPLFAEGHPLRRLVRPTFDTIRRTFRDLCVSAIWIDDSYDPSREGFRPSYDKLYGPGSASMMPFVASWMSTGHDADHGALRDDNLVLLPADVDKTIVEYARRIGLLGAHAYVGDIHELKRAVRASGRRVYSIDDLGPDFDDHSVIGSELSAWLNSKERLSTITRHAPAEVVKDMYDATLADYQAMRRDGGRVFLKTCNTESAGAGVFIADSAEQFEAHLATIRDKQRRYGLSRKLVIQPEITGRNRSFQVLLDPSARDRIQVIALTDQLVEADGKTYKASINHPITRENVEPIGAAILDMVDRIWAKHPEAFGFLMSDYFETKDGPIIYDPGIRPTGNTATAMAYFLARKLTGEDLFASLIHLHTKVPGLDYGRFAEQVGSLVDPGNLVRERRALLPWGWNAVQGFGMLIGVAANEAEFGRMRDELAGREWS
ncbi:MAG: hypothetical protein HYV09_06845 [Deltaproteobacteria bacterium]|nr:hypothetical protein [Deltaproteobacteria bacterium]